MMLGCTSTRNPEMRRADDRFPRSQKGLWTCSCSFSPERAPYVQHNLFVPVIEKKKKKDHIL